MSTELRGRFKRKLWVRPTCTDESDAPSLRHKAKADFKKHCPKGVLVAAPDAVEEAFELSECAIA
jgi:hypothetical protein